MPGFHQSAQYRPHPPNRLRQGITVLLAFVAAGLSATAAVTADDVGPPARASDGTDVPPKVARYIDTVFTSRDLDHDGVLSEDEWRLMPGDPQSMDRDQDSFVTKTEFQRHVLAYGQARAPVRDESPVESNTPQTIRGDEAPTAPAEGSPTPSSPASVSGSVGTADGARPAARTTRFTVRPSRGLGNLPGWFLSRDTDGDGQLTLREFVGNSGGNGREFDRLDRNGDGLITPREATTPREADQSR